MLSSSRYFPPSTTMTTFAQGNNKADKMYAYWVYTMTISHMIMLVVLTVFVALLFDNVGNNNKVRENGLQLVSKSWIVNPQNCKDFINGECVRYDDTRVDPTSLGGILLETEKPSTGLFSSVNSPFLCLASLVLSCSFSLSLFKVNNPDDMLLTPKFLKSVSLLVLTLFAVLFLFIQHQWNIPFNNLVLVEVMLMSAFLIINTFSVHQKHMYYGFRLLNSCFTYPLIAVSILSMIGEDNSNNLLLVFFSLVIAFLMVLILNNEDAAAHSSYDLPDEDTYGMLKSNEAVGIFTYWLSLIPFIIFCGIRFDYLLTESPVEYPLWSRVSLAFLFAYIVVDSLVITTQYGTTVWKIENDSFSMSSLFVKSMDLVAKFILLFFVILGFYSEFR